MRKRLALTLVLPILWALPVYSQTIFGERMPIVLRDGDEDLHLIRDQSLVLTFLTAQQLIKGRVSSPWANIGIAFLASLAFEAGQASAGHQISLVEVFMTPAIMSINLFALPWNKKPKAQKRSNRITRRGMEKLKQGHNNYDDRGPNPGIRRDPFVGCKY